MLIIYELGVSLTSHNLECSICVFQKLYLNSWPNGPIPVPSSPRVLSFPWSIRLVKLFIWLYGQFHFKLFVLICPQYFHTLIELCFHIMHWFLISFKCFCSLGLHLEVYSCSLSFPWTHVAPLFWILHLDSHLSHSYWGLLHGLMDIRADIGVWLFILLVFTLGLHIRN